MRAHFRPEFLNRVDDIVLFKPLTLCGNQDDRRTAARAAAHPAGRPAHRTGADRRGQGTHRPRRLRPGLWRPAAQALPAAPLETPLSRKLMAGEITDHSRVTVDFKKGELVFRSTPLKEAKEA